MAQRRQLLTQAQTAVDLHFGPFRVEGTQRLWQGDRLMAVRPRPLTACATLPSGRARSLPARSCSNAYGLTSTSPRRSSESVCGSCGKRWRRTQLSHGLSRQWADRGIASSPRSRLPSQKSIVSTQSPVAHRLTLLLNNCELRTGNGQLILWAASGNWPGCVSYSNVCDEASARRCSSSASPGSARPPWSIAYLIE